MSEPVITVTGGNPTPDELAALLVALLGPATPVPDAPPAAAVAPRWAPKTYLAPHSWHLPRPVPVH